MADITYLKDVIKQRVNKNDILIEEKEIDAIINTYNEFKYKILSSGKYQGIYDVGLGTYKTSLNKVYECMKKKTNLYKMIVRNLKNGGHISTYYKIEMKRYNDDMKTFEELGEKVIEETLLKANQTTNESFKNTLEEKVRNFRRYYEQRVQKRTCRDDFSGENADLFEL